MGAVTAVALALALRCAERAELDELRRSQPGLWLQDVDDERLVLRGRLALADADGREVDSYLIELRVPRHGRPGVPEVFERAGRIPRIADRHISTNNACCIEHPVEYLLRPRQTLAEYVNGQVRSYFIAQSYFEQFKMWPHGELGHGVEGTREFCASRFGEIDIAIVAAGLELLTVRGAKHQPCACGSRRKFIKCHYGALRVAKAWPAAARALLVHEIRRR